jgi:hypothetical protein
VRVVVSDEVRSHIDDHGGVLYVRTTTSRCCTGALTRLEATTDAPADPEAYRRVEQDGVVVFLRRSPRGEPAELVLTLEGRRRPHPCAYWDGCALVL